MFGLTRTEKGIKQGKKEEQNTKIVGILTGHGLCSTEDVRNFLSEQVTLKGQLEAQARYLIEKLVSEEERADNAEKELMLD